MVSGSFFNEVARGSRLSFALSRVMLVVVSAVGGFYAFDEMAQNGAVADGWFILLLIVATAMLLVGEHVLRSHMIKSGLLFFQNCVIADNNEKLLRYQGFIDSTWSSAPRIIFGIIYGAAVSSAAFFVYERANQPRLGAWLAAFLFGVNFVTGAALTSLFQFIKQTSDLVKIMSVDIWNMDNPTTKYIIDAYNLIALVGVVYVSASLTSIVFSSLQINMLVVSYGAFAIGILGLSMFLPYIPIVLRASEQRSRLLERIASLINWHVRCGLYDPKLGYVEASVAEVERLVRIRTAVERISLLPHRTRVIGSFLVVLVTSWIPVVAKTVLDTWWK